MDTTVRKPTAPMIDVMVRMFMGEEGGNMSVWTDNLKGDAFRKSTLKGLITRGFVQVMDDGWTVDALYITKLGVAWLVEHKHAVVVEGRHVVAGVTPMTDVEISRHIRDAHLEAALYAHDMRVVGDYFNNVNRRADVIGVARPGQKSRQWEIVHQVAPYGRDSTETTYLVYNVNVPYYTDYLIVPKSRLTNLY